MITFREMDKTCFTLYDSVPQNVDVHSEYRVRRLAGGLGGLLLEETPVAPYVKDLSQYERAAEYEQAFDIATWRFYMAFDGNTPVGALTLAGPTEGMNMLSGRRDCGTSGWPTGTSIAA